MTGPLPHPSEYLRTGPDPVERVTEPAPSGWFPADAPLWFRVGYVSVAVFAGPSLLAAVVGLVAVLSAVTAGVMDIVKKGAGL